ncbi:unnamed protein product [Soboliphyme baturini]|uniref:DUF4258 domain-containing protein n=1 Tax=Soboliphyme baturini TaxID=241478 RepID=A0A183J0Q7_9BILA|nr:unnamed protein product [Soboliphyme baturini]
MRIRIAHEYEELYIRHFGRSTLHFCKEASVGDCHSSTDSLPINDLISEVGALPEYPHRPERESSYRHPIRIASIVRGSEVQSLGVLLKSNSVKLVLYNLIK